jgi:hypothetical protein
LQICALQKGFKNLRLETPIIKDKKTVPMAIARPTLLLPIRRVFSPQILLILPRIYQN